MTKGSAAGPLGSPDRYTVMHAANKRAHVSSAPERHTTNEHLVVNVVK